MLLAIHPEVIVPLGAPLTEQEIELLPENLRAEARDDRLKALEQTKADKIINFYSSIAQNYRSRKFTEVLDAVGSTEMEINQDAKELVRHTLMILLVDPLSNENDASRIVGAICKIGEKPNESPWKEKIRVKIEVGTNIISLIEFMKDRWDNDQLSNVISQWEKTNSPSVETLIAGHMLGVPSRASFFLKLADRLLNEGSKYNAVQIYNGLLFIGVGINFDGKNRNEIVSIANSGDCKWHDKIIKAAIKAGVITKSKSQWKF
jgi:hypothetical protein